MVQLFGRFLGQDRLNLGCARNPLDGFVNVDFDPRADADVYHNLEDHPLPFEDSSFDSVFASHVMEHITDLFGLMVELHRVLRPGGRLIAITPYGSSDDAWDCPQHVRGFTEMTWQYFDTQLYERGDMEHAGFGAWQNKQVRRWEAESVILIPYKEFQNDPDIEFKKRHWRNIIEELQVVLKVVK